MRFLSVKCVILQFSIKTKKNYFMKRLLLFVSIMASSVSAMSQDVRCSGVQCRANTAIEKGVLRSVVSAGSPARVSGADAVMDTPAGQLTDGMTLSCYALYPRGYEIYERRASGKVSAIVEGDDGCVYVKNPVAVYPTGAWLRLERGEKDTLVARLPQSATGIMEDSGETFRINFDRLDFDEDEGYYYPSFGESELKFVYRGGVLSAVGDLDTENTDGEMMTMLGLTFDNVGPDDPDEAWVWFGVADIVVRPQTETVLTLPEGVGAQRKIMTADGIERPVWVATDGSDVYLRTEDAPGYALGTVADGKAVFQSGQYLGIAGGAHCYFYGGTSETLFDEDYGEYTRIRMAGRLAFDWQKDDVLMKTDSVYIVNEGDGALYSRASYKAPVIADYVSAEGIPADPSIERFLAYDDFDEYGVLVANIPATTVGGGQISKIDLYYNVYVDDRKEPYVFSTALYDLLGDDMTDVPYSYDNDFDFEVDGEKHTIVFYEDFSRMGVQTVNTAGGKTFRSSVVWTDGTVSGIGSVGGVRAVSGQTFDLSGRRVSTTTRGLYIKSVIRPDGTVRMVKVAGK